MDVYKIGVVHIVEKMEKSRLRWFGDVWCRLVEAPRRRQLEVEGDRETIGETIKKYLDLNDLSTDIIYDKTLQGCLIHVIDGTN